MTKIRRIIGVSAQVSNLDEAVAFNTDVLGCEVTYDTEPIPGDRIAEVVPLGSSVAIVLVPKGSQIPVAIRTGTTDANEAHARISASKATVHNDEVLRWPGVPPMLSLFADPDGNGLVHREEERSRSLAVTPPVPSPTAPYTSSGWETRRGGGSSPTR